MTSAHGEFAGYWVGASRSSSLSQFTTTRSSLRLCLGFGFRHPAHRKSHADSFSKHPQGETSSGIEFSPETFTPSVLAARLARPALVSTWRRPSFGLTTAGSGSPPKTGSGHGPRSSSPGIRRRTFWRQRR